MAKKRIFLNLLVPLLRIKGYSKSVPAYIVEICFVKKHENMFKYVCVKYSENINYNYNYTTTTTMCPRTYLPQDNVQGRC